MTTIDAKQIEVAMHPVGTLTFANIIDKLEIDAELSEVRKRDLISGLRRVADALGRQPEEMIADPHWLQPRLSKVVPAALRLTEKTWQNVVSNARAALSHFGIVKRRNRRIDDLQPAWKLLWQAVLVSDDRTLTAGLGRFVHFLNILNVAPEAVTQQHADAFLVAVKADEIAKHPEKSWRDAVCAWTLAAKRIDGWPQINLVVPKRQNVIKLPDEGMPPLFLADLAKFNQLCAQPDLFADDEPIRSLKASTIKHRTAMLKRFASELLNLRIPAAEIDSVAAICEPIMAKRGLQAMVARNDNKTKTVIDDMAGILVASAVRLRMDESARAELSKLARCVSMSPQKGMTSKNRDRLRVLRDDSTLRRLLELPDKLCAMGRRMKPKAAALAREDALAIAILLACPLRIGNIAAIHIDRNLQRPGDGRLFLNFDESEVKNHRPMEFEVPREVRLMLDRHLAIRTPLLCPFNTPWLFPRRDGTTSVDSSSLSTRLTQRIRKETGIEMNPHLFRHLAAMLWLDANPGSYEAARRLLGHSSVSRTINVYSSLETHSVFEAFGNVLKTKKGKQ